MVRNLILILLIINSKSFCQNLIQNGSFEDYYECPKNWSESHKRKFLPYWVSAFRKGTPDYYNKCGVDKKAGVPNNSSGISYAFHGNAYIGIVLCWGTKDSSYAEYIQTKINIPLEEGAYYTFSLRYKIPLYRDVISNGLGVCFTEKAIKGKEILNSLGDYRLIDIPDSVDKWLLFEYTWKATGKEKYITVGRFILFENFQTEKIKKDAREKVFSSNPYVYIDDVQLYKTSAIELKDSSSSDTILLNQYQRIDSLANLKNVVQKLKENSKLNIELRCKDISCSEYLNYLKLEGIEEKRIRIIDGEKSEFKLTF